MVQQRLYNRTDAAKVLGKRSVSKMRRLEQAGMLTPIKLGGAKASTYYAVDEVNALAQPKPKKIERKRLPTS